MNIIKIKEPIWKTMSVGLREGAIESRTAVEILYINKRGQRPFPHIYVITRAEAMKYPVQLIKGIRLRIIPINKLEIFQEYAGEKKED